MIGKSIPYGISIPILKCGMLGAPMREQKLEKYAANAG